MTSVETKPEVPDWVNNTPYPSGYEIHMHNGDEVVETVHLTRDEYITCKAVIAGLRHYKLPATGDEDPETCEMVTRNLRLALNNAIRAKQEGSSRDAS